MCWHLFGCEMYEGKNIHFSLVDNKPLCSFSQKRCNQRRLNGYGFCVRHILEDTTAPFRRCAYVAKSSQHLCTQAIPQGEDRAYCSNHMQVLGMLPRRERKKKEKEKDKEKDKDKDSNKERDNVTAPDTIKMTFGDRLNLKTKKMTLSRTANSPLMGKIINPVDDPDDPYAFHDAAPELSPVTNALAQTGPVGLLPGGLSDMISRSPYTPSLPSPSQSRPVAEGLGAGGLPKAKLYPELAEKLEKTRPSQETKTSKSRGRVSRTVNKLQTKIAQNRIKDKMRKSQESSQVELSPCQVASPERLGLSTPTLLNTGMIGAEFGSITGTDISGSLNTFQLPLAGFSHMDNRIQGIGAGNVAGSAPEVPEMECLNRGSLSAQHLSFHHLPPPYPGTVHRQPCFSPNSATDSAPAVGQSQIMEQPVTTSLSSHTPVSPFLSFSQASSLSMPVVTPAQSQPRHVHLQHQKPASHQPQQPQRHLLTSSAKNHSGVSIDSADMPFSSLSSVLKQSPTSGHNEHSHTKSGANSAFPQTSMKLDSKPLSATPLLPSRTVDVGTSLDLPPPPPYVPRTFACAVSTSVTNPSSVLFSRVQRPKGVMIEKEAHSRLKNEEAVKLYGMYVKQRINNHVFVNSTMSLCTSDEECTDDEMNEEPLPFQSEWKVISDDEEDNELEEDGELPSDLRMVKLGVMRARYRRHCTQTRHANRVNTKTMTSSKKFTLALIQLARSNPTMAAHTLSAIYKKPLDWPQDRKHHRKQIWAKVCQYKDGADKQCSTMCLPYTNHCRKHVMYNVDQQLFQFCTAKNTDSTQCCMPVIDIRHDFPLCYPHALQSEQQKKEEAAELKKRPRKKTKPPALTRPPRKGKKKKGKNVRCQKPIPPDKPIGKSLPEESIAPMEITPSQPEPVPDPPVPVTPVSIPPPAPAAAAAAIAVSIPQEVVKEVLAPPISCAGVRMVNDTKQQLEQALDLEETDFDRQLAELPLEQASRLLEDDAFANFPDDAFNDIFSMADKNGDSEVLAKENEKLERQLAEVTDNVNKAKDTLSKLLSGTINLDEMGEQDTKHLAEVIVNQLSAIPVDPTADPYGDITSDPAMGDLSIPLQPQQSQLPQQPLPNFPPSGSVAGLSRGIASQNVTSVASFLPAGVTTTVNGISVPQNNAAYNQALVASLTAGYSTGQQLPGVHGGNRVYSEDHHSQKYVVQPPGQGHGQIAGYSGLQGLPSTTMLLSGVGGGGGDMSQTQLLARTLSQQQQQQTRATSSPASLPPQGIVRQMEVGSSALHSQQGLSAETLHPQPTPTAVNPGSQQMSRTMAVHAPQVVGSRTQQNPITSGLSSQLQAQPVLAAQLSNSQHSTWVPSAALQQQQQQQQQGGHSVSYHAVNGFPSAPQLAFSTGMVTAPHTLPSNTVARQTKLKSHPTQTNNVTQGVHSAINPTTVAYTNLAKLDPHTAAGLVNTMHMNPVPTSAQLTGLKQDPRIAALTQPHSRVAGRSGSPGLPGYGPVHSPSPAHSPQAMNQNLPPFSPTLAAYQGNGTGS